MIRKTIQQVLKGTTWERFAFVNQPFYKFMEDYGDWKCKFPGTLQQNVSYDALFQKFQQGKQFIIFQEGQVFYGNFYKLSPLKDALVFCYKKPGLPVELFEYRQTPFAHTILLPNLLFLAEHFDEFYIFKTENSIVTSPKELVYIEPYVAISKEPLSFEGPYQDASQDKTFYVLMRYLPNWHF